jgi:hypothetical protein
LSQLPEFYLFLTQKIVTKFSEIRYGLDPRSGIRKKIILDLGSRGQKAPEPGSGSATLKVRKGWDEVEDGEGKTGKKRGKGRRVRKEESARRKRRGENKMGKGNRKEKNRGVRDKRRGEVQIHL